MRDQSYNPASNVYLLYAIIAYLQALQRLTNSFYDICHPGTNDVRGFVGTSAVDRLLLT